MMTVRRTSAILKVDRHQLPSLFLKPSSLFSFSLSLSDEQQGDGTNYIDLVPNPERYTGYSGHSPRRIWNAIYRENCFRYCGMLAPVTHPHPPCYTPSPSLLHTLTLPVTHPHPPCYTPSSSLLHTLSHPFCY